MMSARISVHPLLLQRRALNIVHGMLVASDAPPLLRYSAIVSRPFPSKAVPNTQHPSRCKLVYASQQLTNHLRLRVAFVGSKKHPARACDNLICSRSHTLTNVLATRQAIPATRHRNIIHHRPLPIQPCLQSISMTLSLVPVPDLTPLLI